MSFPKGNIKQEEGVLAFDGIPRARHVGEPARIVLGAEAVLELMGH